MSVEPDELHQLIEQPPDSELPGALLRRDDTTPLKALAMPPAWFGAAEGKRTDAARRSDELLAEGFGRAA